MRQPGPQASRRSRPVGCTACGSCLVVVVLAAAGAFVAVLLANRPPAISVPTPPMPRQNARDDFVQAAQMARGLRNKSPLSMPVPWQQASTPANLRACAEEAQPILPVLHRGFARSYRDPAYRSAQQQFFGEYAGYREVARTLAGVAGHFELAGEPGRAADARLDCEEMGVMIAHGGTLIADLVGIACEAIGLSGFEKDLPRLSRRELAHVASRLDRIAAKRVPYGDVAMDEGWVGIALTQEALRGARTFRQQFEMAQSLQSAGASGTTARQVLASIRYVTASKDAALRENLRYYRAVAAECRQPYMGKSRVPVPRNPIARVTGPEVVVGARSKHVSMEAAVDLLRVEVALYRYRADRGRCPATLSALAPAYLASVPDDRFGGKAGVPLRYRTQAGGHAFVLYSVGPDMRDDGGTPGRYPGDTPGDIVAGRIWRPRRLP